MRKLPSSSARVAKGVRTLRTGMLVFACTLLITVAGIGGNVRRVSAAAGQYVKISVPDAPNATFYVGRCFRTNFRVQTDGLDANSVDLNIPYNPTYIQPFSNSGCTSVASSIITHSLFPSYPANTISDNRIQVTAYDPTGSSPVDTGAAPADQILGYLFWKVMSESGAYKLDYNYTQGLTTDTNMAENNGDGTDVLDGVENITLNLSSDGNAPTFASLSPANNATNVSVTSAITFVWSDTGAGINQTSLQFNMNGTTYTPTQSSCTTTNSNRKPQCNASVTPGTLGYATTYTVTATGGDLAAVTNTGSQTWSFSTEDDDDAPYVQNLSPGANATGIATTSNIQFNVKDYKNNAGVTPGLGVDSDSIEVTVTVGSNPPVTYVQGDAEVTIAGIAANRTITINPAANFPENTLVQVSIEASDLHVPPNVMTTYAYSFTTVDSQGPQLSGYSPAQSAANIAADTNISFTVTDNGAGIDIDNTTVTIEGTAYTSASPQFSYTGTPASYTVTVNPASNFSGGQTVDVSIGTRDLASPTPNTATVSYSFTIANTCTTCSVGSENPARFVTDAVLDDTISFHIRDTGAGIDQNTIRIVLIGTGAAFPTNPLILTGSSPLVSISGTSADYTVTVTLAASLEVNVPYGITIDASDINGLDMSTTGYTFINSASGSGTSSASSASSCPVVTETVEDGQSGGRRGQTLPPYTYETRDPWPEIVRRWILPDGEVREQALPANEARQINRCYIDALHEAAPRTPYGDVEPDVWYEDAVVRLLENGTLDATQKDFRPTAPAVRAEFATMLVRVRNAGALADVRLTSFDDTDTTAWYHPFIEKAAKNGWVLGYNDCYGSRPCFFKPFNTATRAEAAAMIVRSYKLQPLGLAPAFKDVTSQAWYADEIGTAADYCLLQGDERTGDAAPDRIINRAEMAVMIDRAESQLRYGRDCGIKTSAGGIGAMLLGGAGGAGPLSLLSGMVLLASIYLTTRRKSA